MEHHIFKKIPTTPSVKDLWSTESRRAGGAAFPWKVYGVHTHTHTHTHSLYKKKLALCFVFTEKKNVIFFRRTWLYPEFLVVQFRDFAHYPLFVYFCRNSDTKVWFLVSLIPPTKVLITENAVFGLCLFFTHSFFSILFNGKVYCFRLRKKKK